MKTPETIPGKLTKEVNKLVSFFNNGFDPERDDGYDILKSRLDAMKFVTREIDDEYQGRRKELRSVQAWFRSQTDQIFLQSPLMTRARTWPKGFPGDYETLECVYQNQTKGKGLAKHLDQYFLSCTLAVAVRSRFRKLASILDQIAVSEKDGGKWLNLACGSCRELLHIPNLNGNITVNCVDSDPDALEFAKTLVQANGNKVNCEFICDNAFDFCNPERNKEKFGELTTIYSAGLFDYINTKNLILVIQGLYASLAEGGKLVLPFKDKNTYETFDYHWMAKWHCFMQRDENEFMDIFHQAGIPEEKIEKQIDDTSVILFYQIQK